MNKNIFQCPTINKNQATNAMCVILLQYFKCEATITYFKYEATITNVSLSFIIHSMKNRKKIVLQMDKEINTWKSN
jgi:hypothetical protein